MQAAAAKIKKELVAGCNNITPAATVKKTKKR